MNILPFQEPTAMQVAEVSRSNRAVAIANEKDIAHLIDWVVEKSGVSQVELARRLGITPQSLNQYKMARRCNPSVLWLARLVSVTGGRLEVVF